MRSRVNTDQLQNLAAILFGLVLLCYFLQRNGR